MRIISGAWRRQRIGVPALMGLRPTGDRVRETLFNWLGASIEGAVCADLFAGTGALGLEAASRGAAAVTLIEKDVRSARALGDEYARLHAHAPVAADVRIQCTDALSWLRSTARSDRAMLDIAFVDPPFGTALLVECLELLVSARTLSPGARVYVETAADDELGLPEGLELMRSDRAGRVRYHLAAFAG